MLNEPVDIFSTMTDDLTWGEEKKKSEFFFIFDLFLIFSVRSMFRTAFDESHAAGGKSATGHSPAVAAVKVLTQVIITSKGTENRLTN